jgi:folate-binding Fe-S cluster repair protein YgfZ
MIKIAQLASRAVLSVSGEDRVSYLQGLVSNDVALAEPGRAVWAALLTPQGKWLADFFIFAEADRLLLDVEAAQAEDLARRLMRFRLRAKVYGRPIRVCRRRGGGSWVVGWRRTPRRPITTPIACASAYPTAAGTWRRRKACCWRPDSTN